MLITLISKTKLTKSSLNREPLTSKCPRSAASCRGVQPAWSLTFGEIPDARSLFNWTTSFLMAALCSTLSPLLFSRRSGSPVLAFTDFDLRTWVTTFGCCPPVGVGLLFRAMVALRMALVFERLLRTGEALGGFLGAFLTSGDSSARQDFSGEARGASG